MKVVPMEWSILDVAKLMENGANLAQCWDILHALAKSKHQTFPKFSTFLNLYSERMSIIRVAEDILRGTR
jgi:hypothetical protein